MPLVSLLLCCVFFVPADQPLSIAIKTEKPGIVDYDKPFSVVLTNNSDKPVKVWKHRIKNGYDQLKFQFVNAQTGEKVLVSKWEIEGDEYWKLIQHGDDRESDTVTIAPHAMMAIRVNFSDFTWGHDMWKGLPSPNITDRYRLTAQFELTPGPDAVKQSVWTGKVSSQELSIHFLAAALATPHEYLHHGFPDKAVDMMKADPAWIKKADTDKWTPLHHAAQRAHLKALLWLLNNGADVNANPDFSPLSLADDPEVVELLLQKKPDLSLEGNSSAFHKALSHLTSAHSDPEKKKWQKIVDLYLKAGAEYDLITAIRLNDLNKFEKILAKSTLLADNFQGSSPLRLAASLGRFEICQYLIEKHDVDINDIQRGTGYPIIKEALKYPKIVKLLIDHKVDLKTRITWQGGRSGVWIIGDDATALHYAAVDGVPETVKLLLDAGVDLFADAPPVLPKKNDQGQTALDVAAIFIKADNMEAMLTHPQFKAAKTEVRQALLERCLVNGSFVRDGDRLKLIQLLVAHGANPLAKVRDRTGIHMAVEEIHPPTDRKENAELRKIIAYYRAKGAVLDLFSAVAIEDEAEVNRLLKLDPKCASDRRSDGYPALHMAVSLNNKNIVIALLKSGCDVNIGNQSDHTTGDDTPLHAAAFWGQYDIARLLIDAGANVNAVYANKHDPSIKSTPLSEAKRLHNERIVKLLIDKGAKEIPEK